MKKVRILITEDEQIVAEDLKMSLETMGYSVVGIANSGERARFDLRGAQLPSASSAAT